MQQGSLVSKAYRLLAQQYFSAGPLLPPLLYPLLEGGPLLCSLWGGGGSTSMLTSGGSTSMFISGGSTSMFTSSGGVHFHVHFWGGPHVTYPIMFLYITIECPSASRAKFTWDPPPLGIEQTERQTLVKTLPSRTTWRVVIKDLLPQKTKRIVVFISIYVYHFAFQAIFELYKNEEDLIDDLNMVKSVSINYSILKPCNRKEACNLGGILILHFIFVTDLPRFPSQTEVTDRGWTEANFWSNRYSQPLASRFVLLLSL